jgi:hypothetical protein
LILNDFKTALYSPGGQQRSVRIASPLHTKENTARNTNPAKSSRNSSDHQGWLQERVTANLWDAISRIRGRGSTALGLHPLRVRLGTGLAARVGEPPPKGPKRNRDAVVITASRSCSGIILTIRIASAAASTGHLPFVLASHASERPSTLMMFSVAALAALWRPTWLIALRKTT